MLVKPAFGWSLGMYACCGTRRLSQLYIVQELFFYEGALEDQCQFKETVINFKKQCKGLFSSHPFQCAYCQLGYRLSLSC